MNVSAKVTSGDNAGVSAEVTYDFGENLQQLTDKLGEEVVFSNAVSNLVVTLQSGVRRCLKRGEDPQAWADGWIPGVSTPRGASKVSKIEKLIDSLDSIDDIAELKRALAERKNKLGESA